MAGTSARATLLPGAAKGAVVEVAARLLQRDQVRKQRVVGLFVVRRTHALELGLQLRDLLAHPSFL